MKIIKRPDIKTLIVRLPVLVVAVVVSLSFAMTARAALTPCPDWPLWQAYLERFVQEDGRVIDFMGEKNFTTSEGQAYSLFFALVANDRKRFDTLLNWTKYNLSQGDFSRHLPAWRWGQREDGQWGILDPNPASDSDMWIAYTLFQAGRLWKEPKYTALGHTILGLIKEKEVVDLPGLGPMVLPGLHGFALGENKWRLNPSYLPVQLLRAFNAVDKSGPWKKMTDNTLKLIRSTSVHGFTPDWVLYEAGKGWQVDPVNGPTGSYDAIRVYMWAGLLDEADPVKRPLLQAVSGMHQYVSKKSPIPPEKVNTKTGKAEGSGPPGFSAALLPYLKSLNATQTLEKQRHRLRDNTKGALVGEDPKYYDQVLALFGLGASERRFSFDKAGQLLPNWKGQCTS